MTWSQDFTPEVIDGARRVGQPIKASIKWPSYSGTDPDLDDFPHRGRCPCGNAFAWAGSAKLTEVLSPCHLSALLRTHRHLKAPFKVLPRDYVLACKGLVRARAKRGEDPIAHYQPRARALPRGVRWG